jgi:hypothetical protein
MKTLNHAALRTILVILISVLFVPAAALADSDQYWIDYYGYHPIPEAYNGGFCERDDLHQHEYAPVEVELYNVADGVYYFVGDPSVYGYVVNLYWYEYHHPVPTYWGGGYCYLVGAHRHWWEPWSTHFVLLNGHYHYRGPWGPYYRRHHRVHHHAKKTKAWHKKTGAKAVKPASAQPARTKAIKLWKPAPPSARPARRWHGKAGHMKARSKTKRKPRNHKNTQQKRAATRKVVKPRRYPNAWKRRSPFRSRGRIPRRGARRRR